MTTARSAPSHGQQQGQSTGNSAHTDPADAQRRPLPFASSFATIGDMARFGVTAIANIPFAVRYYFSEVIRQAGILVLSSSLILWVFGFMLGFEGGMLGYTLLDALGAADYIGLYAAVAVIQALSATSFNWIFAAKVGCGFAAELGTMRVTEEIDALAVMGLRPKAYLVGTRLAAFLIVVPFMFLISVGFIMVGAWLVAEPLLNATSPGGYSDVFWSFQTPSGIFSALAWAMIACFVLAIVSCYFGYNATGGPVGVGRATARSMGINMIMSSVFTGILYQVFFGVSTKLPIAN